MAEIILILAALATQNTMDMPNVEDAAAAYNALYVEHCRWLIDQDVCWMHPVTTTRERVENLRCSRDPNTSRSAICTFQVERERCEMKFVRDRRTTRRPGTWEHGTLATAASEAGQCDCSPSAPVWRL